MARMCRGGERTEDWVRLGRLVVVVVRSTRLGLGWVRLAWLGSAWLGLAWLAITSTIDLITLCDSLAPVVSSLFSLFFFSFVRFRSFFLRVRIRPPIYLVCRHFRFSTRRHSSADEISNFFARSHACDETIVNERDISTLLFFFYFLFLFSFIPTD